MRFLLSAVVGTIISMSVMSDAAAGPGECPDGITPSFIDKCYFEWLAQGTFDPVVDGVTCYDDAEGSETGLSFYSVGAQMVLGVQGKDRVQLVAVVANDKLPPAVCDTIVSPLTDAQSHSCRSAILSSAPWRQICRTQATAN